MRGQDRVPADGGTRPAGPIRVTLTASERRRQSTVRWLAILVTTVVTSVAVIFGARFVIGSGAATAASQTPQTVLDARAADPATVPVKGSTRFVPVGPALILDTRGNGPVKAGADTEVPLNDLPAGASAVLAEVSIVDTTGAGDVTVDGGAGPATVLRVPRAGVQMTANAIVQIGPDRTLVLRSGGGDLLVNLVGAFQPAETSSEGRIVTLPPSQVVKLIPKRDGKEATVQLNDVAQLRDAGSISAVLLQVTGDVGPHGGRISAGPVSGAMTQTLFWGPTKGADRTRVGFLAVPVTGDKVRLRYVAGTEMRADLVGYVTGEGAPVSNAGLVVPVTPADPSEVRVTAGGDKRVAVVPETGLAEVPAGRVAAALLSVTATGDAVGAVTAYEPGRNNAEDLTVVAPKGTPRGAFALVATKDGAVQVRSESGAAVSVAPRALVLS
ncbi:hypothetical protein AB0M02_20995 [Actinoplanes sp. NPDC051861]|uniref:hypothetical protein n=1 Tax=Actinoplanes sp. NPDC051861 TaxID=3155170 RepID=UPI0034336883